MDIKYIINPVDPPEVDTLPEDTISLPSVDVLELWCCATLADSPKSLEDLERVLYRKAGSKVIYLRLNERHLSRLRISKGDVLSGYGDIGRRWLKKHPWVQQGSINKRKLPSSK